MAWQGARLRPSRYSASGGSRRPQRKIEHRSLPPASIAASDSVRTERKGERRPLAPRRSGMSPNASHRVRPGLSSAASLITTLLISFDQEVLNQQLNLVTPEYPFFESPWDILWRTYEEVNKDRILAVAAGVTFYALLAIFPAVGGLVSIYGLF